MFKNDDDETPLSRENRTYEFQIIIWHLTHIASHLNHFELNLNTRKLDFFLFFEFD